MLARGSRAAWSSLLCAAAAAGRGRPLPMPTPTARPQASTAAGAARHHPRPAHAPPGPAASAPPSLHDAAAQARSSRLQALGYAAACLGGLTVGVAASAVSRGGGGGGGGSGDGPGPRPPRPRPPSWQGPASPLEAGGRRHGAAPSPPPPAAPDADAAEEAAAAAAVAASLTAWPVPTAKLACDRRRPSGGAASSATPRPVVLVAAGAFNPPTIAHLRMCEAAAAALRAAGTPVLGAFLSPVGDGYGKPGLAPAADRVAMCEAAVSGVPGLAVDAWEALEGTGGPGGPPTRTLHVLRRVQDGLARAFGSGGSDDEGNDGGGAAAAAAAQPPPRVMLVCGSDLLASLAKPGVWKAGHVQALAGPDHGIVCVGRAAVAGRGDDDASSSTADAEARAALAPGGPLAALAPAVTYVADPADLRGVSSSLVRAALAGGHPVRWLTPQPVLDHIAARGLYGCVPPLAAVSGGEGGVRGRERGPAAGTDM